MRIRECQLCDNPVELRRRVDVPKKAVLCERCFAAYTYECDRCHQVIASPAIEGGELLDEAPIVGEMWCRSCSGQYTALCDCCRGIYLLEHLTSVQEGLLCERCLRRKERLETSCSLPLALANELEVVGAAIRGLPGTLQGAVECLQSSDDELRIVVYDGTVVPAGGDDKHGSQITVRHASMPTVVPWPMDSMFPLSSEEATEQQTEWSALIIAGSTVGVTFLHRERAYEIDLEQAIQSAILGEMHELGLVSRDEYGRFVDDNGDQFWP